MDARKNQQRDLAFVILFSGLMGLFLGLATGWQVAVESAQVVAGIVQYPRDNPFAMYHLKTWTLLHQLPAALLVMGVPERVIALGIAGLTGIVSFTGLALCAYVCGAGRFLASMTPVIIMGAHLYGELSSTYPIRILSDAPWVLYGCFGTSLALLIWCLLGSGYSRTGAFLMGLSPAMHPTLGAWCLGLGALVYAWNWRHDRAVLWSAARYLALGLSLTMISLMVHLYLSRGVPDIPTEEKASYVTAFAANWDSHRRPFPMDHLVVLSVACGMILCGVGLRYFREQMTPSARFLLQALLASAAVSLVLCVSTEWQDKLPTILLMVMPARFINVAGLAFPALCLGFFDRYRPTLLGHLMLAGFVTYLMLATQRAELGLLYVPMPGLIFLACVFCLLSQGKSWAGPERGAWLMRWFSFLGPFALAALATDVGLKDQQIAAFLWFMFACTLVLRYFPAQQENAWWIRGMDVIKAVSLWLGAAIMLAPPFTICLMAAMAAWRLFERREEIEQLLSRVRWPLERQLSLARSLAMTSTLGVAVCLAFQVSTTYATMEDWTNHAVYARAYQGSGMLLTASTVRATQLRTRRPVLLEGPALNQLPYVPESGRSMNRVLREVYGEDLFAPRPANWARGGGLDRNSGRKLWENRELREWQALAREFGFTQIVTYDTWKLKLPRVARSEKLLLYDIPGTDPGKSGGWHISRANRAGGDLEAISH